MPNKTATASNKKLAEAIVGLAQLSFEFAETNRFTLLPSGQPESDTDHTFMLSLVACSIAATYETKLDIGRVAQFALVHDLVEAYAKDTATARISKEELAAKMKRELDALELLKSKFGKDFPWIHKTIEAYEQQTEPEARFIKVVDKAMPALTHLSNDAAYLRSIGINDKKSRLKMLRSVDKRIENYAQDQALAYKIRQVLESKVTNLFDN